MIVVVSFADFLESYYCGKLVNNSQTEILQDFIIQSPKIFSSTTSWSYFRWEFLFSFEFQTCGTHGKILVRNHWRSFKLKKFSTIGSWNFFSSKKNKLCRILFRDLLQKKTEVKAHPSSRRNSFRDGIVSTSQSITFCRACLTLVPVIILYHKSRIIYK